jgi:regulatory protein
VNDDLRQLAMRLLARREHSRVELERKLSRIGSTEDIAEVVNHLQQSGLLSDVRYAESYVRSHGARLGAARMRHVLRGKGVDGEVVAASIASADLPDELERARALWLRKFGEPSADKKEWARQARFLQARGFSSEVIRRLLKDPKGEE